MAIALARRETLRSELAYHNIQDIQFSAQNYEACKKQESTAHSQEKEKLIETVPEEGQTLDLGEKDFKSITLSMLKYLKETMDKELKETRGIMSQKMENIVKEREIIKRNQIKILELKSTITNVKILLERFSIRCEQSEGINDLENRSVEISQTEEQKEKE